MQFNVCLLEPGTYRAWKRIYYVIGIRAETRKRINEINCSRGIYLSAYILCLYLIIELCLLV